MASSRSRLAILLVVAVLIVLLVFLLGRCTARPAAAAASAPATPPSAPAAAAARPAAAPEGAENLTPATLSARAQVPAGSQFEVNWTGPANRDDYIAMANPEAPVDRTVSYGTIRDEKPVSLTAPLEPGRYQLRYIAIRSRKILGTTEIEVTPVLATLSGPAEVVAGAPVSVAWTGPNNRGDYITIVPKSFPDERYGNNNEVRHGSPLIVTAPIDAGPAEIRYLSGQGRKVLARRDLNVVAASVTLSAPAEVIAGTEVSIDWTGPKNAGDYITIVPKELPEGRYGNNAEVRRGSPLVVVAPIDPGACEVRYVSGQGSRVLGRRPLLVRAAEINLQAPGKAGVGSEVSIEWKGPSNSGDYLTIVPKSTPDGRYGNNSETRRGSPLTVTAPMESGDAEIRYMSGQGSRVLARRAIQLLPAEVSLQAPAEAKAGSLVSVEWTGPANRGDYLTIVPAEAKEGAYRASAYTNRGSPVQVKALDAAGPAEIRYVSGQGSKILGRKAIVITGE